MIGYKVKIGSWGFMGSPIGIWSHPIGSGVWITPLPIPYEIMHPSLMLQCISSCGILLNCIYTWCPKIYCAWLVQEPSASSLIANTQNTKSMVGPWPWAPHHDLNTIYTSCTISITWGQNRGVTTTMHPYCAHPSHAENPLRCNSPTSPTAPKN